MKERSKQGVNVAFIGMNRTAQTSCAEYMRRFRGFKRLNMDEALQRFLRTSYWYKEKQNMSWKTKLAFYDAMYKVDNEIFVKYVAGRLKTSHVDTVIPDVRYLGEMKALKEMGFIICRVTTNAKQLQAGKYVKSAEPGSVALSLVYDKRFSINHSANYALNWTSKGTVGPIIDAFLDRIGFKFDK